MSTLNIRIEQELKNEAMKVLANLGLDISSAVKMFLSQVVNTGSIPFVAAISKAQKIAMDRQVKEALKGPGYKTADEMFRAILDKDVYDNWK